MLDGNGCADRAKGPRESLSHVSSSLEWAAEAESERLVTFSCSVMIYFNPGQTQQTTNVHIYILAGYRARNTEHKTHSNTMTLHVFQYLTSNSVHLISTPMEPKI